MRPAPFDNISTSYRLLIQSGADLHARDRMGRTPRDVALEMGELEVISLVESAIAVPDSIRVYESVACSWDHVRGLVGTIGGSIC